MKSKRIRNKAEKLLKKNNSTNKSFRFEDRDKLLHELQVYQIELEMQNEELRLSQRRLEESRNKYVELYDFAPAGYLTIDKEGNILEANLTSSKMFGVHKKSMIGKSFSDYITWDYQDTFYLHCKEIFKTKAPRNCELKMKRYKKHPFYVQLESYSVIDNDSKENYLRTIMVDISERKEMDEKLAWQAEIDASLVELLKLLLKGASVDHISHILLETAKRLTGSPYGYTGYIDRDTNYFVCPAITKDMGDKCQIADKAVVFKEFCGLWGWVLKNKKSLITNCLREDYRSSGAPEGHLPVDRFISVPVMMGDRLAGQISLANSPKDYGEKDLKMLESMASIYALSLQYKLKEEEIKKFKTICDAANYGIGIADIEGKIIYINQAFCGMHGYMPEEILGKNLSLFHNEEQMSQVNKLNKRLVKEGDCYVEEVWHQRKDGTVFPALMSAVVIKDECNNPLFIAATAIDIAERKKAEENLLLFRKLMDQINDSVFIADRESASILDVNMHACNKLGYTRKELLSMKVFDLDERISDIYSWKNSVETFKKAGALLLEGEHRKKDGSSFPVEISVKYLEALNKVVGVARDITERKKNEEELENYRKHLEEMVEVRTGELENINKALKEEIYRRIKAEEEMKKSLEEKEILLKEIHHRVKNNLQVISSLLSLQSGYTKEKKISSLFKESQSRIRSMGLIHEILYQTNDFARIDFSEYIPRLAGHLARSYGLEDSLKINVKDVFLDIDRSIPCGLIINELVSNSLKHAFSGMEKGEIYINFYLKDNYFILEAGDNGTGFPEDLDFQNTSSLGLQLVSNLVEQIEGTIELERIEGTRFKIKFSV